MDVRSYWGANINSYHYLVIDHLRTQISNVKKVTGIRTSKYNAFKLTTSAVAERYRQWIEGKLNHMTVNEQDNGQKVVGEKM